MSHPDDPTRTRQTTEEWSDAARAATSQRIPSPGRTVMPLRARILILLGGSLALGCVRERPVSRDFLLVLAQQADPESDSEGAAAAHTADALLQPCRPNPFRGCTDIGFELRRACPVRLAVYDLGGRLLAVLVDDQREAGYHETTWCGNLAGGRPAAAGVYLARLDTPQRCQARQMALVR
jgi:hypothetical protein